MKLRLLEPGIEIYMKKIYMLGMYFQKLYNNDYIVGCKTQTYIRTGGIALKEISVGVIAGTPVDSKMGVDFLRARGIEAKAYPVSSSPQEQSRLQILSPKELSNEVALIVRRAKGRGASAVMVYCNSLSAAVDMDVISRREDIMVVTPLDVYRNIAGEYEILGVMAANNQSCAGIERTIQGVNPGCDVVGIGVLPLVQAIESQKSAGDIADDFLLENVMGFYEKIGAQAVILGCTHFSYIKSEVEKISNVKVIDPSQAMCDMIVAGRK